MKKKPEYAIGVLGVTLTGNMGAPAMMHAVVNGLSSRAPDGSSLSFHLFTLNWREDSGNSDCPGLKLVDASIIKQGLSLALALVLWPLSRFQAGRKVLSLWPIFRKILEMDFFIDISGIAFVDKRGVLILAYNLAVFLPAALLGRKVCKLAQAFGPFQSPLNRLAAGLALRRCSLLVARGRQSGRHLEELGCPPPEVLVLPDIALTLPVEDRHRRAALEVLAQSGLDQPEIIISPSRVVMSYCASIGLDYIDGLARVGERLRKSGRSLLILSHSSARRGKNDDERVCRLLEERMDPPPPVICGLQDPRVLRMIFAQAELAVVSRFHAMISALAVCTPALVVGWSHKYRELLDFYQMTDLALNWPVYRDETLLAQKIEETWAARHVLRERLKVVSPKVEDLARRNYSEAWRIGTGF
jgi:polysaccharide pyruvyl transferase WcaK-like protein